MQDNGVFVVETDYADTDKGGSVDTWDVVDPTISLNPDLFTDKYSQKELGITISHEYLHLLQNSGHIPISQIIGGLYSLLDLGMQAAFGEYNYFPSSFDWAAYRFANKVGEDCF